MKVLKALLKCDEHSSEFFNLILINTNTCINILKQCSEQNCFSDGETGVSIRPGGGYILANNDYNVGLQFDMTMMVKPRGISGILLAVHGDQDYLILQMHDGNMTFTAENGQGPFTATFRRQPDVNHWFDEENWHDIHG